MADILHTTKTINIISSNIVAYDLRLGHVNIKGCKLSLRCDKMGGSGIYLDTIIESLISSDCWIYIHLDMEKKALQENLVFKLNYFKMVDENQIFK